MFDFSPEESKARCEYPKVVNNVSSLSTNSLKAPIRSFCDNGNYQNGKMDGASRMMGSKKHRTIVRIRRPYNQFMAIRRGSSPTIAIHKKDSIRSIVANRLDNTSPSPIRHKRSNSTISAAGAGIKQGLINIGNFLQAAHYIITLTLVFSMAWLPLGAVVFADTITRNLHEGFHKAEG